MKNGYTKILLGQIELDQAKNIAREVKSLWRYLDNLRPGGAEDQCADIRLTRDSAGQYWAHMNDQALTFLLLFCKDIPKPSLSKQTTDPEMPADFLKYDP